MCENHTNSKRIESQASIDYKVSNKTDNAYSSLRENVPGHSQYPFNEYQMSLTHPYHFSRWR